MQTCSDAESVYSHLTILCIVKGFSFMFKGFPGLLTYTLSVKLVLPFFGSIAQLFR